MTNQEVREFLDKPIPIGKVKVLRYVQHLAGVAQGVCADGRSMQRAELLNLVLKSIFDACLNELGRKAS